MNLGSWINDCDECKDISSIKLTCLNRIVYELRFHVIERKWNNSPLFCVRALDQLEKCQRRATRGTYDNSTYFEKYNQNNSLTSLIITCNKGKFCKIYFHAMSECEPNHLFFCVWYQRKATHEMYGGQLPILKILIKMHPSHLVFSPFLPLI